METSKSNATHELLIYPNLQQFDFYAANFTTIDTDPAEKTTMTIDIEYGEMTNNYWTVDFNKTTPGEFLFTSGNVLLIENFVGLGEFSYERFDR